MLGNEMSIIESIRGEYLRYKKLAEAAIAQAHEGQLSAAPSAESNSIATICWHVSGNLKSRFSDFLTATGEALAQPGRGIRAEDSRSLRASDEVGRWLGRPAQRPVGVVGGSLSRQVTIRVRACRWSRRSIGRWPTPATMWGKSSISRRTRRVRLDLAQQPSRPVRGFNQRAAVRPRLNRLPRSIASAKPRALKRSQSADFSG